MVVAALLAIALSLSYYEFYHSGSRETEESALTRSTTDFDHNSGKSANQASNSSAAESAKAEKGNDAEALQQLEQELLEAASAEDELDGLAIAGAVLDDAGQLIQGATVVAQAVAAAAQQNAVPQRPVSQQTQTTGPLGSFEFNNLIEGEYELTATKGDDFFPARLKVRAGMANAELILQRFRTLRVYGTISDDLGIPLEGVKVRTLGTHFSVQSDASGRYQTQTAPMRAGAPPVLEFKREDFKKTRRRIEAALNSDREEVQLDVQMEPESDGPKVAVAGQVRGPLGEAVAGVSVRLKSFKAEQVYSARTDDFGEFNIPEVEVLEGYTLSVEPSEEYEAYQSEVFSLVPQDEYFEIEVDSAKLSNLSGTVTDLTGKPLSGFQLWLRGIGTSAQSPIAVRTDASGRFQLERLRAGEVRLESRSQPLLSASNIVLEPKGARHVDVPLDWGNGWLLGRVVDSQGQPVSGASIIVRWEAQLRDVVSNSRRNLRSDLEGFFTVSNLGADVYDLTVQAPGLRTIQLRHELDGGTEELLIQLPLNGATEGAQGGG